MWAGPEYLDLDIRAVLWPQASVKWYSSQSRKPTSLHFDPQKIENQAAVRFALKFYPSSPSFMHLKNVGYHHYCLGHH